MQFAQGYARRRKMIYTVKRCGFSHFFLTLRYPFCTNFLQKALAQLQYGSRDSFPLPTCVARAEKKQRVSLSTSLLSSLTTSSAMACTDKYLSARVRSEAKKDIANDSLSTMAASHTPEADAVLVKTKPTRSGARSCTPQGSLLSKQRR